MKKILCLILFILLLCGCSAKSKNIEPITRGLSFECEINYYNEIYECNVAISEKGETKIDFSSPKEISGLKLLYLTDKVTADYYGLQYDIKTKLPQFSMGDIVYKVFSQNYDTVFDDDGEYYVENKNLNCKIYLGATGLPIKIEENSKKFHIIIKNATIG